MVAKVHPDSIKAARLVLDKGWRVVDAAEKCKVHIATVYRALIRLQKKAGKNPAK